MFRSVYGSETIAVSTQSTIPIATWSRSYRTVSYVVQEYSSLNKPKTTIEMMKNYGDIHCLPLLLKQFIIEVVPLFTVIVFITTGG